MLIAFGIFPFVTILPSLRNAKALRMLQNKVFFLNMKYSNFNEK